MIRSAIDGAEAKQAVARAQMIEAQLLPRGIKDPAVIAVMNRLPRDRFVPVELHDAAYEDGPLSIGHQQTISQPAIVGLMTQALKIDSQSRVLEIGTGSGYQTAVLASIARQVYTIECIPQLAERAQTTLSALGFKNIEYRIENGSGGWPEAAPFDAIIVTAAPKTIPNALTEQLAIGAHLVSPVGDTHQELMLLCRTDTGIEQKKLLDVRFVPMRE